MCKKRKKNQSEKMKENWRKMILQHLKKKKRVVKMMKTGLRTMMSWLMRTRYGQSRKNCQLCLQSSRMKCYCWIECLGLRTKRNTKHEGQIR